LALRDYKKGRFLLSSKPGQLLPGASNSTPQHVAQQRRVFDKVWVSVEKIIGEMAATLNAALQDPTRSVEDQEKTIE
jgi:exocyst complex component 2